MVSFSFYRSNLLSEYFKTCSNLFFLFLLLLHLLLLPSRRGRRSSRRCFSSTREKEKKDQYRNLFDGFICIGFPCLDSNHHTPFLLLPLLPSDFTPPLKGSKKTTAAWTIARIIARCLAMATLPFTFLYLNETP